MDSLVGTVLTVAFVASLTPLGIMAILFVSSGDRRWNGVALTVGWGSALALVTVVAATLLHDVRPRTEPSRPVAYITLVLGCVLVGAAVVLYVRSRRAARSDTPSSKPTMEQKLSGLGPRAAVLAGVSMAPYPPAIAMGSELVQTDTNLWVRLTAAIVFGVVSVWLMLALSIRVALHPDETRARMAPVQRWIAAHGGQLGRTILALLGVYLIWRGIAVLSRT